MNLDRYSFIQGPNSSTYEFHSEGPIGMQKKIVHFGKIRGKDESLYNLAFGDWIDDKENFDDKVVYLNEISELFVIQGYRFGTWELFEKSKSYKSFLLRNKKSCRFNN